MAAVGFPAILPHHHVMRVVDTPGEFIEYILNQHEELYFLADDRISFSDGSRIPIGISPSMCMFDNNQYPYFDRAITAQYKLELIFLNDYQHFIADQQDNVLSPQSFSSLKEEGESLLRALNISKKALSVALVLKNVCQAPSFRELFDDLAEHNNDESHVFWGFLLRYLENHNQKVLSFFGLTQQERAVVANAAALAHFDHIFADEKEPHLFEPLNSMPGLDPNILNFALFVERCDRAGAAPFNQAVFDRYQEVQLICQQLIQ